MKNTKKITPKQIAALICVIILVCMYLITLIVACLDFPGSDRLFSACLLATIGLPILLWIYIGLYNKTKERQTAASANLPSDSAETAHHTAPNPDVISETDSDV